MSPIGPAALILLVIPAIAVQVAVRALYGPKRLAATDPMQMLLSLASAIMFALAAMGVCIGLFGFWVLVFLLPIFLPMIIIRLRHAQHRALIWALAAAAQRGIPLSEAARAYADETLGDTGLRALALAEAIERGEPLSSAVRIARLRMSAAVKMAVRLGERLGLLGPAMKQQMHDSQSIDMAVRDVIGRFTYLGFIVCWMTVCVMFVMLRIVPVFQKMFEEFGLKLPAPTLLVINMSKWYVEFGWWQTAPLLLVWLVFLVFGTIYFVGFTPRDLPVIWRLFQRYDGALMMRGLALAVRRGLPMPQAMRMVADCYPLFFAANQMRSAAERASAGMDWRDSLRQTGLISHADAAVFAAAERVGNLDWALEEMADSAIRRQIYRAQALLQILFPIVLVIIGCVVGMFVIGLFIPIISLIQGLT